MHTIKVRVDEEKDLYNSFDADDVLLSEDVKAYISGQLTSKKIGDHVEISIVSPTTRSIGIWRTRVFPLFSRLLIVTCKSVIPTLS